MKNEIRASAVKIDGFSIGEGDSRSGPSPLEKLDRIEVMLKLKAGPKKGGYGMLYAWLHLSDPRHTHTTYD